MGALYEMRGEVAVITLDNPPVNGLGYSTRRDFVAGVERALGDDAVQAIVITGAGRAFSGGADIKEFGSPKSGAEPNLLTMIRHWGEPALVERRGDVPLVPEGAPVHDAQPGRHGGGRRALQRDHEYSVTQDVAAGCGK